ncbi:MAG: glutamine--fructose-6-phosphate transaminase (isomerizing) [Dehalococcoidia bacterium]|nr:glutamine--fructose-6-phosphate transaminase (isomerizing) [Dehalococcoidia bacterium]
MCGIFGYTGKQSATPVILEALKSLEYRGYDSAGIAVIDGSKPISIARKKGKLSDLENYMQEVPLPDSFSGIGHTRWATHGAPSDMNAHPHTSYSGSVVVAHNGIVENHNSLRFELKSRGRNILSETDSEVIAHLLEEHISKGLSLKNAVSQVCSLLEGSQSFVAMSQYEPGVIVGVRLGNAGGLVIGFKKDEAMIASDVVALLPHTQKVAYLANRQVVQITENTITAFSLDGDEINLDVSDLSQDIESVHRGQYEHLMLKEIMDQPEALSDTIQSLVSVDPTYLNLEGIQGLDVALSKIKHVVLLGMGTSFHAALIGRCYIEKMTGLPTDVINASEFRNRQVALPPETLLVSISQSGETVDVLEAMNIAKEKGVVQITVSNSVNAQTSRVADGVIYTRAGVERGVASTKTFTTSIAALYLLALRLSEIQGHLTQEEIQAHVLDLIRVPALIEEQLQDLDNLKVLAKKISIFDHFLFLGRGNTLPIALEGALKMKEVSYIHAEGYPAGEMKHGPIALIDDSFPTFALAGKHSLRTKTSSNIEQILARNGKVFALLTEGDYELKGIVDEAIFMPETTELLEPFVATIAVQCLAYYVAYERGCEIDQPRNLAKTVTVE